MLRHSLRKRESRRMPNTGNSFWSYWMSQTDVSFNALRNAIRSLWSAGESRNVAITAAPDMLILSLPDDVAAFSVFNSHPAELFQRTYDGFKHLYGQNSREWDRRTLSFALCRSSE